MSSDTESTVCDPRLEVAPEPQVPKGPGQIRRVPQLFTATARSTPVVPPQVQQVFPFTQHYLRHVDVWNDDFSVGDRSPKNSPLSGANGRRRHPHTAGGELRPGGGGAAAA